MRKPERKYSLIKFVESNENPDGIYHNQYDRINKNGEIESVEKHKPFKFMTYGCTRLAIYDYQQSFPECKGRGYKVISYPYGSDYEIFEK